jgi:hypothetical protein
MNVDDSAVVFEGSHRKSPLSITRSLKFTPELRVFLQHLRQLDQQLAKACVMLIEDYQGRLTIAPRKIPEELSTVAKK